MSAHTEKDEYHRMYLLRAKAFDNFIKIYKKIDKFDDFERKIYNILIDNNLNSLSKLKLYQDMYQNQIWKKSEERRAQQQQEKKKVGQEKMGQETEPLAFSSPIKNSTVLSQRNERSNLLNESSINYEPSINHTLSGLENSAVNSNHSNYSQSLSLNDTNNGTVMQREAASINDITKEEVIDGMKHRASFDLELTDPNNLQYDSERYDGLNGYTRRYKDISSKYVCTTYAREIIEELLTKRKIKFNKNDVVQLETKLFTQRKLPTRRNTSKHNSSKSKAQSKSQAGRGGFVWEKFPY